MSLHKKRWNGLLEGDIPILRYISAMSHTRATGKRRKRISTSKISLWSFGPWQMTSFNDSPLNFADASKTTLVFVVVFSGLTIAKCGRYQAFSSVLEGVTLEM